jgi:hypothetical protein
MRISESVVSEGVSIECECSNLAAILDSIWTARLQLVDESPGYIGENRLLPEGEVVVENLRYCEAAEELTKSAPLPRRACWTALRDLCRPPLVFFQI